MIYHLFLSHATTRHTLQQAKERAETCQNRRQIQLILLQKPIGNEIPLNAGWIDWGMEDC